MKNKIVLVTGGTSGIGLGIAKGFAELGAFVIINGFVSSKEEQDNVCKQIGELNNNQVAYYGMNLADPLAVNNMMDQIIEKFSRVDILINSAGIQFVSSIEDFPDDKWENIIRVDLIAAFYTIKHVLHSMKENKWGRIINIASAHALVASPFKSAYVAAKHGILGLTKTVALEVAEYGVTVNSVCPGYVRTPLVLNQIANTAKSRGITEEEVMKNIILGAHATKKFVEIEEVVALVTFLCSNHASSITGAALSIDGGWTAQ